MQSGVQDPKHSNGNIIDVVDDDVPAMDDQLACAGDTARPPESGTIHQAGGLLGEPLIERDGSRWIVGLDVILDCFAVLKRFQRPDQRLHFLESSRCRVAARLAANRASTSSAGITRPLLAESSPI